MRAACGEGGTIEEPERLRTYECDGLTGHRAIPALVCLPPTAEAVQAVVRACHADGIPFVARGAGTGLSGGALPVVGGVVISVARMRRILEIDLDGGRVVVEPGVANLEVTRAVAPHGYFYAPDPSSQQVCTIGGNVAENSGGAHCLKHGFTVNHVCGLSIVLSDGELVELGGKGLDEPGPGPARRLRRLGGHARHRRADHAPHRPPARADHDVPGVVRLDRRGRWSGVGHRGGRHPARRDRDDGSSDHRGRRGGRARRLPRGRRAPILITELDGVTEQVAQDLRVVEDLCRRNGCREIRVAHDDAERAVIWKGRKAAFAAVGRISPDYYVQDGVVPRTQLPAVLRQIQQLSVEHGLRVGNVFHAGDGNLHPLVLYDGAVEGEADRAELCARAILDACVAAGGSITGEHGVGVDKACAMSLMFTPDDLAVMARVRNAFDPAGLANPGKLLPTPRLCGEAPGPHRMHPLERAGLVERL